MLFPFLLFIFELITLEVQSISIDDIDPLCFKINKEKFEIITMTLILNEEIINRNNSKIYLSKSNSFEKKI